ALPDRDKDVTAWAYASVDDGGLTGTSGQETGRALPPPKPPVSGAAKPKSDEEKAAAQTASAILDDRSPYVAISVRPRLPRWRAAKEHLHVLVVDASRSMFGERFARATHLAAAIVREMDRRDAFMVLACDTICRPMTSEAGGSPRPEAPGAAAAGN